jgi:hypothetical protein
VALEKKNIGNKKMTKIDSDKLLNRIQKIDPYLYDNVSIKWKIIKLIKQMAEEQENKE